jgi:hypothetical protein
VPRARGRGGGAWLGLEREGALLGDGLVVDGAELEQAGCAGAVETTRLGWTRGARRSVTPPLPGAPDPTAVPRPREGGGRVAGDAE